ncbi:MAG: ABC transporter substrate-binding protein [Demequina sp.]
MKLGKFGKGAAVIAMATLALAACTSEDPQGETTPGPTATESGATGGTNDDTIYYSVGEVEWAGYNSLLGSTYSTYNSAVNDRVITGFTFFGPDATIERNEDMGTFELISEDPMVVEFTINEAAVWSDGTPITYDDALFSWASQAIADGEGEDGTPVPLFDHVSGLDYGDRVPAGPEGEAGGKTFTLTYESPFPDYQLQTVIAHPAHVMAREAGTTVEDMSAAIKAGDVEALRPVAEFWNTGLLSGTPGELPDPEIALSSGPYTYGSWEAGQSITLVPNENYWGDAPATRELVFRFAAPETHVQALANGDLNAIEPQATVDTISQIEALGDAVTLGTFQTLTWEHLDINRNEGGSLAESAELREAFAMCVPRQLIIDNLIAPVNPDAVMMNAREVFPFQDSYDEVVSASYDGRYDEVDIDGAAAKIAEAGVDTPVTVRIGYSAPNQRRTDQVALIKDSCDQAGFEIQDIGADTFFAAGGDLDSGNFDVALFAWQGSGQIASGQNIYSTGRPQNYIGYSNADVDAAWEILATTLDTDVQLEQTKIIEQLLWDDMYGIPIFAHPGVAAWDSSIQNVEPSSAQGGLLWNAEEWVRAD